MNSMTFRKKIASASPPQRRSI